MNSVVAGRAISADDIRQIWSAIKYCQSANVLPVRAALLNHLASSASSQPTNWRPEDAELKLQQCIDAGVVTEKMNAIGQDSIICAPEEAPQPAPDHDWYCFVCHGEGSLLKCQNCFRVYHPHCLSSTGISEKPKGFTCLPCLTMNKIQKFQMEGAVDSRAVYNKIDLLMTWIVSMAGSTFDLLPDDTVDITEEQAQWIIYNHIDLNSIRNNLNRGVYSHIKHFALDFELLVHDAILLFGKDSKQGELIKIIWKDVKKEIDAFEAGMIGPIAGRADYVDDGRRVAQALDDSFDAASKKRRKMGGELALDQAGELIRASLPKDSSISRPPTFLTNQESASMLSGPPGSCGCDMKYKQLVLDLQQHWLNEFKLDREKVMVDLAERMHRDFNIEQEKLRSEMLTQFKQELEATKKDLDQRYTVQLKQEIQRLNDKHKKQISETKKKQWCWHCESEAIYHCCWNTAYCSVECQQAHWNQHRKFCRRKKQQAAN